MTQYRDIAEGYAGHKELLPVTRYAQRPSFWNVVGDVTGLDSLDLATGHGPIARGLQKRGAARVIALDLEQSMVGVSRARYPQGIQFLVADADNVPLSHRFDLVTGGFLLHYSPSRESLQRKVDNIYRLLAAGGRFVGLNQHPEHPHDSGKYGMLIQGNDALVEGEQIQLAVMHEARRIVDFTIYHWSRETYEQAFEQAGFSDLRWHELEVSPEGLKKYPSGFWDDYLAAPSSIVIEAQK